MLNRHIIKNVIYIISISVITLIVATIMINACANWSIEDPLNYLSNPSNFYELEMCDQSLGIVSNSLYVNAGLLAIIGFFQIFYSKLIKPSNKQSLKDSQQLTAAGRFLLVVSVTMIIFMRIAFVSL
ncbi:MAG: hypothetical protein WC570_02285 [Patescibacteria group bacterium]